MPKRTYTEAEFKRINYELFIWLLTFLSIFNVVWVVLFRDPIITAVVVQVNRLIGFIFMIDFLIRLHEAPSRREYFLKRYGWLDLISSLPILGVQLARLVRFVRTTRILAASGEQKIFRQIISSRANTALLTIGLFVILLFEFGSMAILAAEAGAVDSNIETANEALWWVLVTISTVGYGDYFPVTVNGRVVAVFVIIAGVAVFGTLSGFLSKLFSGQDQAAQEDRQLLHTALINMQQLQQEQAELKQLVQDERDVLQEQLTAMEQLLQKALSEKDA